MSAGQDFAKKIGPLGGAFFLLLFALFLIYCFTAKPNPLTGYTPPQTSSYYAQSEETLSELKTELENNVFPRLGGDESCALKDGKLVVITDGDKLEVCRSALTRYYDESLFEFEDRES